MQQSIADVRAGLRGMRGRQVLAVVALLAAIWVLFRAGRGLGNMVRFAFAMAWVALWTGGWFWAGT